MTLDTQVLRAQMQSARTRRDLAGVQADRRRELFAIGGLSRQALDEADAASQVLEAELAQLDGRGRSGAGSRLRSRASSACARSAWAPTCRRAIGWRRFGSPINSAWSLPCPNAT